LRKVVFTVLVVIIATSIVSMAAGAKNSEEKVVREPLFYNELAKLGTDEIIELAKKNKTIRKIIEKDRQIKPVEIESLNDIPEDIPVFIKRSTFRASTDIKTVYVWVVADEEFRSYFGNNWKTVAYNIIESADNAFFRDHNINFVVGKYSEWDSNDNTRDPYKLLKEAQEETGWNFNHQGMDMLAVFTNQPLDWSGASEIGGDAWIIKHQYDINVDWHLAQHEASHNYNVPDHGWIGPYCIMTYIFTWYTDQWCDSCDKIIEENRNHFD
jgi:hypothetical protein